MLIESRYKTFYLMALVLFALSATVYEIFGAMLLWDSVHQYSHSPHLNGRSPLSGKQLDSHSSHLNWRSRPWEGLDSTDWPSKIGQGRERQLPQWRHSMANVKSTDVIFTFFIFAKKRPEGTKGTDIRTHGQALAILEILKICLKSTYYPISPCRKYSFSN